MRYLIIFVLFISVLILSSDEFELINLTNKSKKIEQILSDKLHSEVVIHGDIILKLLPTPHLEIINLKVFDQTELIFSTNKIILELDINQIFKGISQLNRISVKMQEASLKSTIYNKYLKYLTSRKNKSDIIIAIDKAIVDFNEGDLIHKRFNVTNLLLSHKDNQGLMTGQFDYNYEKIKYSLQIFNDKDISLQIDSDGFTFDMNLNDFNKEKFAIGDGKLNFKLKKLNNILQLLCDKDQKQKTSIDMNTAVEYTLNISGDLLHDINNELILQNLKIDSNFIDGLEINFRLYKVMDDLLESYLYLSADKVNLSYIKDIISDDLDLNYIVEKFLNTSNISHYINLNFNLKLQKLIFDDCQINNVFFSTYHILNRVIIDRLDMELPGKSLVTFNGLISENAIRRQINGELDLQSDDDLTLLTWYNNEKINNDFTKKTINFNSKIFAIRNLFKASHFFLTRGKEELIGNASLYSIPYEAPVKMIVIDSKNIDLDKLGIRSEWDIYLQKLYDADSDKSGEEYFKLTNANHWLRSINKHFYLNLKLQDSIFRDIQIPKVKAMLEILPGELDVKKLTITSDKIDGAVEFKFILPVLRPNIISNIYFKTFDLQYGLNLFLPKFTHIANSTDKINFFSANNYDAAIKLEIDNLIINDDTKPQSVNCEANLKFGYLEIPNLKYSLWNGQFDTTAIINIATNKPKFSYGFNIYNINPQSLFYQVTDVNKINGYMSFVGTLEGDLITLDDIKRINGNIDFLGAQITWQGFNLDKIIDIVDGQYTADSKVKNIEYYSNNESETFDSLQGQMVINNGLVNIDNASMSTKRLAGLFSMNFDIPSKSIESLSSFAFIPSGFSQSLVINFKNSGNIQNPNDSNIDYKSVSDFIMTNKK